MFINAKKAHISLKTTLKNIIINIDLLLKGLEIVVKSYLC